MTTWTDAKAWAETALVNARTKNDGDIDAIATARLRGRIDALKELLSLPARQERAAKTEEDPPE